MKKGMFVVCGNSIEEIEADVKAMKLAIANGESKGCGSVAYAMGMGGMSDEDIMATVAGMEIGTPPTADDECCGCYCEDDEVPLEEVLDNYSFEDIADYVLSVLTPEELLERVDREDLIEYIKDNIL